MIEISVTRLRLLVASLAVLALALPSLAASSGDRAISWTEDYEGAMQRGAATNSVLLLHFYTDSCPPCKLLDKKTFKDQNLVTAMNENLVPVRINADKRRDLADKYNVTRWPTDVYLFSNGDEIYRGVSDQDPAVYVQKIKRVALRHRDWTVERQALARAQQSRQDQQLAARTPQIQAERPVYAGSAGHPVKSQSAAWTSRPDASIANAQPAAPVTQRIIDNPYVAKQPMVVPAAPSSATTTQFASPQLSTPASEIIPNSGFATPGKQVAAQPISSQRTAGVIPQNPSTPNMPAPISQVAAPQMATAGATPSAEKETVRESLPSEANETRTQSIVADTIGLGGYCPVALIQSLTQSGGEGWVKGSQAFAVRHRGRVYYCASEQARKTLLSNPDKYTPCLSGFDLVHFCKTGQLIDGKCDFGQSQSDRVYLFGNAANCEEFIQASEYYSKLLERAATERVANGAQETQIR